MKVGPKTSLPLPGLSAFPRAASVGLRLFFGSTSSTVPSSAFSEMAAPGFYPGAAAIATFLSAHGWRRGSLSPLGAVAAGLVGYAHLANPVNVFGVGLIFFYLAGSRATKVCDSFRTSSSFA